MLVRSPLAGPRQLSVFGLIFPFVSVFSRAGDIREIQVTATNTKNSETKTRIAEASLASRTLTRTFGEGAIQIIERRLV